MNVQTQNNVEVSKPRWVGITVSLIYGVIALFYFIILYQAFGGLFYYTLGFSLEQFNILFKTISLVYLGLFISLLFAFVGGLICSTGTDTPCKRFLGRLFLWLPVVLFVTLILLGKYL